MKIRSIRFLFIVCLGSALLCAACTSEPADNSNAAAANNGGDPAKTELSPEDFFVGTWISESIEASLGAAGGEGEVEYIKVDESNIQEVLKMLPPTTVLQADKSFFVEIRSPEGEIKEKITGTWSADSLHVILNAAAPYNEKMEYFYVRLDEDHVQLNFVDDFDQKGIQDDEVIEVLRRTR